MIPDADPDSSCSHMGTCPMYALFRHAGTAGAWKARYCTADYKQCARYQAASRGSAVPANLMPNGALLRRPGS